MSQGYSLGYSYSYLNMASAATTTVKTGPGILHAIVVNNVGATASVTIWDNTAASGTLIATISPGISGLTTVYDVSFNTGLTVTTAGGTAPNITVVYQ